MATAKTKTNGYSTGDYPYIAQSKESKHLYNILNACIKAGVPVGFVGNPGVGKTATFEAYAKVTGRELINLSLSTLPPEDVCGLPFPTQIEVGQGKNKHMVDAAKYAIPVWQQRLLNNPKSILFLDEFSTASPSTQHAFLQLVQNRRLPGSDEPFSDEVAIIICMNPAEQAGGSSLDLPIANRFAWFTYKTQLHDWKQGFAMGWRSDKKMNIPDIKEYTPEEVIRRQNKIRNLIIGFHSSEKGAGRLSVIPTGTETPTSGIINRNDAAEMECFRLAYPTPRSWENLANVMTYLDDKDTAALSDVVKALIGVNNGMPFCEYYTQHMKGIDIDEVIAHPEDVDWENMDVNDSAGIFQGLIENAAAGRLIDVFKVYLEINGRAKNLLSGNRVHDIYKADYMKYLSKEDRAWFMKAYREAFDDMLTGWNK